MPRRREQETDEDDATQEVVETGFEEDAELDRVLSELRTSSTRIQLWCKNDVGKYVYLEQLAPDEFSLDAVRDTYGGGHYQARFFGEGRTYLSTVPFDIHKMFQGKPTAEPSRESPQLTENMTLLLLKELMQELREARGTSPASPAGDPMKLGIDIATLVANSTATMVAALAQMQKPAGGDVSIKDMLDVFNQGIELGRSSESDGFGSALLAVAKPAADYLSLAAEAEKAKRGMSPPADTQQAGPETSKPTGPQWAVYMRPWMNQLLSLAKEDANAELWAEVVLDRIPDGALPWLEEALTAPHSTFQNDFYLTFPAAADYRAWFDQLFGFMRLSLKEDADAAHLEDQPQAEGVEVEVVEDD